MLNSAAVVAIVSGLFTILESSDSDNLKGCELATMSLPDDTKDRSSLGESEWQSVTKFYISVARRHCLEDD